MTFENDIILQHLVKYPNDPDVTIHNLACDKDCSLIDAKNMLKRKAKNFFSKKDYYRYFDGDVEVDDWLFANAASRESDAKAEVAKNFPLRSDMDCDDLEEYIYKIDSEINLAIQKQSGKRGERKYAEVLERELGRRKVEIQDIQRKRKCFEIKAAEQEAEDTALIGQLGAQTASMKRGTEEGNTFLFLMIGVGIVGLGLIAGFAAKKGK